MTHVLLQVQAQGMTGEVALALAVLFLVLAFVFILAEIFFVSFGVLTVCSISSFVASFYMAYHAGGPWLLGVFIVLALVLIPTCVGIGLKVMPRTGWGRKLVLPSPKFEEVTSTGVPADLEQLVGKKGITITRCRPSGVAEIDGRRVDVVGEGMMIDNNCPVEVVDVEGNRVVVRRAQES